MLGVTASEDSHARLIALTVHELRTPASVVGGYLRMLQMDTTPMSERQRRMIGEAEKSYERLVAIVAELSDIGKLDSGAIAPSRQPVDLFPLIDEAAGNVQEGKDREVQLTVSGPSSGASISGDAARLRPAFDAILRAMLRERPGPAAVTAERRLDTHDGRARALLVVANTGHTQDACDREPAAFDEGRGGMGLALPLARRVIEAHGGRIWSPVAVDADADPLARGTVLVSFPL